MALPSKKVFLDASVFVAFLDRAHPKHEQAAAFFRFFAQEEYRLFTDTNMIIHAYDTIYKDISPSLAKDFLRTMALTNINILYPEESDTRAALKALLNYRSTELTYSQALMAVLSDRRGIYQVCTFDYFPNLFGITLFFLPV